MKKSEDKSNKNNEFNKNSRSSKFDDLIYSSGNRPNDPGFKPLTLKERSKKIWKWVSLSIYLFLAGLGITGLIQSCVLHTSSTVGAGVELYNKKSDVSPYVTTYQIVEKTREKIQYDENGIPKLDENGNVIKTKEKYYALELRSKDNFIASGKTISKLKSDLVSSYKEHGENISNLYGEYDNYSSSLRILGVDGIEIYNSNDSKLSGNLNNQELLVGDKTGGYIFLNNKILDYLNKNGISYVSQNELYDINYFVAARPEDWNSLSDSQKDFYGRGVTDLNYAFQAFENIDNTWTRVEVQNGEYVTKDVNADGIIDSDTYVKITDQTRINNFKYSLNAEVVTVKSDTIGLLNSEKYSRDYLQSMSNTILKFSQFSDFYNLINSKANTSISTDSTNAEKYNALSKTNFEKLINQRVVGKVNNNGIDQRAFDESKLFTLQEKNAIMEYQNEMTSLLSQLGFGIKALVYSGENANASTGKEEFVVEFLPQQNDKRNVVLGTGTASQKPITSWGDSWKLGPFYGLIVWPLSYLINSIMGSLPPLNGWDGVMAIVIAILVTRVIVTVFTYKSLFSSHKQQQLNPKKAKIDAKYEAFKGNREMEQRKRQEISKLYKSNNVSMLEPFKALCISMPIFFAVWRVVQGIPDIKATTWLGIQFSLTSWRELFAGSWQYLPLLIAAALIQAISQLLPRFLNKKRMNERSNKAEQEALRKSNKTQNIVMAVFIFMSVIFEAGVQIYWIIGGLWQIMQTLVVHHIVKGEWYRTKGHKYV